MNAPVDFTGISNFTPYTGGGGTDLPTHTGRYAVQITAVEPRTSSTGNPAVKVSMTITDDDNKGIRLIKDVPYGGKNKKGEPNVLQFGTLLNSIGMDVEAVRALEGQKKDINGICAQVQGRQAYVEVGVRVWEGTLKSDVKGFVAKEVYARAVQEGTHRQQPVAQIQAAMGSASAPAAPQLGGTPTAPVAMPGAAPQPGLGLGTVATQPQNAQPQNAQPAPATTNAALLGLS